MDSVGKLFLFLLSKACVLANLFGQTYSKFDPTLQRIQVERLTVSVVAFVVTVELIALRGKMTDVARWECQRSAWENHHMLFPR